MGPTRNPWMLEFLMRELELTADDVYHMKAELDYDDLKIVCDLNIPAVAVRALDAGRSAGVGRR